MARDDHDPPATRPRAVVLHSGGIDSTATLAQAVADGCEACAITFDYGQRHRVELEAAERVAHALGVTRRLVFPIDLRLIGGSALTDSIEVPRHRTDEDLAAVIPTTYVPARNLIFLSVALAWAETIGARDLYAGVNAVDYSGYPDCRPEFIAAFNEAANLATKIGFEHGEIRVHTPLAELGKAEIIRRAVELGVDLGLTHSCYDPSPEGLACGGCDSCILRRRGFEDAGVPDPTRYAVG